MGRPRGRQPWTAVPRQDGRTVVVTGASSGIGLQAARMLAAFGAHVVLAVRNPEKGESVARELPGSIEVRRLDVADLASVRAFAEEIGPVDVLVNNAGIMAVPFARTADGFESQLATNHLGHFALTNLMLPKLTDRVVVVGSAAHRSRPHRPRRPELGATPLPGLRRLRASKLANLLFLAELQRRLTAPGSTLRATGAHPGYTSTAIQGGTGNRAFTWIADLGNSAGRHAGLAGRADHGVRRHDGPPRQQLRRTARAGEMLGWPTLVGRSPAASDPELGRALWSRSEALTGTSFPL